MALLKTVQVLFFILVSVYSAQIRHRNKYSVNETPSSEMGSISKLPDSTKRIQEWVVSTIGAAEQRLNRKIHDFNGKIRRINRTVDIAHLESVFYLVSEELVLSEERDAARDSVVNTLENTISEQRKEIHQLKKRLGHLEETLIHITSRLDAGIQFTAEATSAASGAPEKSSPASGVVGELLASTPTPVVDDTKPTTGRPLPQDCEDAYRSGSVIGFDENIAEIKPSTAEKSFRARCNVKRGEGWTVIQRRTDGSVDFFRNWQHYKHGFGSLEGEFWLGLQKIHELTAQGKYKLRLEMTDWEGTSYWAEYDHFRVGSESDFYRLHVHGYHGNAGDSLTSKWDNHSGQPFSTLDRDNDARYHDSCAEKFKGAWWFTSCFESHLNGIYYQKGAHNNYFVRNGIQWNTIHVHSSLQFVEMMLLPNENAIEPDVTEGGQGLANNNIQ